VKVSRAETVAASAPQKRKPLPAELAEERRQGQDDQRVEGRREWRSGRRLWLAINLAISSFFSCPSTLHLSRLGSGA
jgi:hypothetical protein